MVDNYRWLTHEMRALPAVVRGRKILACSRLSVAGDELKRASERKNEGGLRRGMAREPVRISITTFSWFRRSCYTL